MFTVTESSADLGMQLQLPILVMLAGLLLVSVLLTVWLAQTIRAKKRIEQRLAGVYRELDRTRDELKRNQRIDPVTGLVSGGAVRDDLRYAEVRVERSGEPFGFVLLRINNLGAVRRTHGDTPAENLLTGLAKAVRGSLRKQDIVSRWADDEFLLLLPETNAAGADVVAGKLRALIESGKGVDSFAVTPPDFFIASCVYDGSRPVEQVIAETGATFDPKE